MACHRLHTAVQWASDCVVLAGTNFLAITSIQIANQIEVVSIQPAQQTSNPIGICLVGHASPAAVLPSDASTALCINPLLVGMDRGTVIS